MGKLNVHGCLISRFYPADKIHRNFMHAKITCFLLTFYFAFSQRSNSICQAFDGQTEFLRVFNFTVSFAKFTVI